jgi:lysozyme
MRRLPGTFGGLSDWMRKKLFQFQPPESPTMMGILLPFIKAFEGYYAVWYRCPAGVRTIGYGHTGSSSGLQPAPWSEEYASRVLQGELEVKYIPDTIAAVNAAGIDWDGLTPHQQAALVSFAYNLGAGAIPRATFIRQIKAGADRQTIRDAWHRWNRGGDGILPGLVRRRFAESLLYFTGRTDTDPAGWRDYYGQRA